MNLSSNAKTCITIQTTPVPTTLPTTTKIITTQPKTKSNHVDKPTTGSKHKPDIEQSTGRSIGNTTEVPTNDVESKEKGRYGRLNK
jgi:hypothetical protein